MSRLQRKPKFKLRARTVGVKLWTCVFCGHLNKSHMVVPTFKVQCSESRCRARFVVGETFYLMPGGGKLRSPADRVIPDETALAKATVPLLEAFPEGTLARRKYRSGQDVNRLILPDKD